MRFSSKSTGVGCQSFLQGIFPTQGSKLGLLYCRQILYQLSYKGIPKPEYKTFKEKGKKELQNTFSRLAEKGNRNKHQYLEGDLELLF